MIGLLTALVPAVSAPFVGMRPARSLATRFLVGLAVVNVVLSGWFAVRESPGAAIVLLPEVFVVDATSRLFLLLVNLIFLGVATYVAGRVWVAPALREGIERYVGCALAFVAAANLAVLAHHLMVFWIFLEATTFAAIPLIRHGGGQAARRASWKYLLFSAVGLALAFLGLVCLARGAEAGSLSEPAGLWRRLGFVLVSLGFGTKLGFAPMYSWLPETYDAAPPATTALLAAVQFNVALVGLLRVLQQVRGEDQAMVGVTLVSLGLATMAVSAFNIIAARNYKKLIAYAAINHGGVIAVGLGIGRSAAYGVILYAVSNAFIKAILFLTAGKIRSYYKTEQIREVSGLIKDLPYSGLFFMIGTFALLGFPPFGSFLGELIIMSGLVGTGYNFVFATFCLILTVAFVATGRAVFPMIWGEPKKAVEWKGQPLASIAPKLVFMVALVAMGLYLPRSVNDLFREVASSLGGGAS